MARIKVEAWINTEGLDADYVDLTDDSGLTLEGFTEVHRDLAEAGLEDISLELDD